MAALVSTIERATGRIKDQGLLFEYTVKLVVLTAFFELILYRLVSRLGMHLSKVAAQHPWVGSAFRFLSSIGFGMLNVVAIFLFIALAVLVLKRLRLYSLSGLNVIVVSGVALLLLLTAGFLIVEPAMLGSIAYNVISFILLTVLMIEYLSSHHEWAQRLLGVTYYLGISGWLYYQILSTTYGWLGSVAAPPLVYEVNRAGEALMVLSSIIVFWAYGRGTSFLSRNKQQRRRAIWFWSVAGSVFGLLLFFDYFLEFYNPAMAHSIRKASQGIGWIFQMGMGYTFYLPFALYVAGLLCWAYTVIKLISMGRLAGYGLALMFIAGYALLLSNLTMMVILGVMLLTMDRQRSEMTERASTSNAPLLGTQESFVGGQV